MQVLDSAGKVAGTTEPALGSNPVLPPAQVRALRAGKTVDVTVVALDEDLRLAAAPAEDDGEDYTVIVGASLEQRQAALADLSRVLLLGGPIALLLASLAGYGVAAGRAAAGRAHAAPRRGAVRVRRGRAGGCRCRPRTTRSPTSARP